MDITTAEFLLYAKSYCLRAKEERLDGKRLSGVVAIMHMQDAIDFCLNAILHDNGIPQDGGEMRKNINDHFGSASPPQVLPLEEQMDFIRATSDKIKNAVYMPTARDVGNCLRDGRTFLDQVYRNFFGLEFDTFCLSVLVTSDPIRMLLRDAECAIEEIEGREALVCLENAVNLAQQQQATVSKTDVMQQISNVLILYDVLPTKIGDPNQHLIKPSDDSISHATALVMMRMDLLRVVEETLFRAVEQILDWQAAAQGS